jgi:hypothetical protein
MKRKGNFIYKNRISTTINQHALMVLIPGSVGAITVLLWQYVRLHHLYMDKADTPITIGVTLMGVIYAIFAGTTINTTWEKYKKISSAVVRKNKADFLELRDEKMPIRLHILLGGLAIIIQFYMMMATYEDIQAGETIVFVTAFSLCLVGMVAIELDNPMKSTWFQRKILPDWLEADVEEFFTAEAEKREKEKERRENILA